MRADSRTGRLIGALARTGDERGIARDTRLGKLVGALARSQFGPPHDHTDSARTPPDPAFGRSDRIAAAYRRARDRDRSYPGKLRHARDLVFVRDIDHAAEVTRALDVARDLTRDLILDLELARDVVVDLAVDLDLADPDAARDLELHLVPQALEHYLDLARLLGQALELAPVHRMGARTQEFIGVLVRVRVLTRELDRAHHRVSDLSLTVGRDINVYDPNLNRSQARDLRRVVARVRALLRVLEFAAKRADALAPVLGELLLKIPIDVSGVDISQLHLPDADALVGVIWDQATLWPEGIGEQIRARSREIRPGVFQVTDDVERDPADTHAPT